MIIRLMGEIDIHSFRADRPQNVDLAAMVHTEEFDVKINVLGLRKLQSPLAIL